MKSYFHNNNNMDIFSTHEGKSVAAERFLKALKNKIY